MRQRDRDGDGRRTLSEKSNVNRDLRLEKFFRVSSPIRHRRSNSKEVQFWILHIMQYVTIAKTSANLCILKQRRSSIFAFISNVLRKKFVRFAVIGGIGILFNDLVLAGFMWLVHLYPVAYVFAFAVSNGLNFVLNQVITYPEHRPDRISIWLQRLLKAEITSVSALLISFSVALVLHYIFHVSEYVANPIGLCFSFVYKYLVSDRFVYRPRPAKVVAPEAEPVTDPMTPPAVDEDTATTAAD